jgi:transposase
VHDLLVNCVTPTDLSSHKAEIIRRLPRSVGAKLVYLPPYRPDLNPIEQVFAKIKTFLLRTNACSVEAVNKAIPAG